jgi:hypothetical protein
MGVILALLHNLQPKAELQDSWEELRRRITNNLEVEDLIKPLPMLPIPPEFGKPTTMPVLPTPADWKTHVSRLACQAGVEPALAIAVIEAESRFNEDLAEKELQTVNADELPPGTVIQRILDREIMKAEVAKNVSAGLKHLKELLDHYLDESEALAVYYAGENYWQADPAVKQRVKEFVNAVQIKRKQYQFACE